MATQAKEIVDSTDLAGLTHEQLLRFYRTMVTSRRIDDREMSLKRQNKVFFQISGAGHEAIGVAVAEHCTSAHDWFYPYYRDRAMMLALGQTPLDHLLQAVGAEADPASGGRQMPAHFGDVRFNIPTSSSPTGTQFLQAVGAAEAGTKVPNVEGLRDRITNFQDDEVVIVCTGDGATSEGEFWESLNTACNLRLPVVYVVQDNGYAISVPIEVQTAGGSISRLASSFPHLHIVHCDGTDLVDSYRAAGEAISYARNRHGPAMLHAHTTRPYSHSMSDDERAYRTSAERDAQDARDPLVLARALLIELGVATADDLDSLESEVEKSVAEAGDQALASPQPDPSTAMHHLYSADVDPTSSEFDTEDAPQYADDKLLTMVDLLNSCLSSEMERDPRIVVFGEDVADASREDILAEVKGKGGVFKVTQGLQQRFGSDRVYNSPLAEANIAGRAVGMATRGLKPVVEIQFFDYIWPAMMQIRNEMATMRYRSNGHFSSPAVVRVTYGGYLKGGGIYHSQTGETLFTHTPGLRVCMPATAEDAAGLLRTAIRCDDPVIFLEHKHLYRQVYNKGRDPGPEYMIPFGKAKVCREGSDVTLVTCGALVKRSLDAAKIVSEQHGIETEVIDLRTVQPFDMDRIATSVKKTNKVVIVHEDSLSWGIGSEIAARIADELFEYLDGPVKRVASMDTWVAYAPQIENVILPQTPDVVDAIVELAAY
ncbi:MAG: dehydrogenase E1 component subunit alpha/beta [Gemmatimonadetes bacterium]|nr:dehydrogenase E1 component subunit alpha/beta [Gemmatimonadota bacterium]MDA1103000.1 dehydrogenase E1 component subunit alpha/beta [Gemmatimonadota bacterium]